MRYLVIYDSNQNLLHMINDDTSGQNGEQIFTKFLDDPENKGITFVDGEPVVNETSMFSLDNIAPEEVIEEEGENVEEESGAVEGE